MQKLKIYIPVIATFLSLAATMTAMAADELKIVYNVGVAPLKFEDAASRPAGLFPELWRLYYTATKKGNPVLLQLVNDGLKAIGIKDRKRLEDKWIIRDFNEILRTPATALPEKKKQIALSAEELAWLKEHPVIRIRNTEIGKSNINYKR